jgi:hypothetical protein
MQAALALALNRRHPDAAGCFFAAPTGTRDLELKHGLGQLAWTGAPDATVMRSGRAAVTSGGTTRVLVTPASGAPWAGGLSLMFRVRPTAEPSTVAVLLRLHGFWVQFAQTTHVLALHDTNSAAITSVLAIPLNVETVCGLRWSAADNKAVFFVNAIKDAPATTASPFGSGAVITVGGGSASFPYTGGIRDVRLWARALPDAAFARYYVNPRAFYLPRRAALRGGASAFRGGQFLPFLQPGRVA